MIKVELPKREKFLIEIIIIRATANIHITRRVDQLDFYFNYLGTRYQVSREQLFTVYPGVFEQIIDLVKGIKTRYLIVFWEDDAKPINQAPAQVSPAILDTVKNSRALGRAIRELFKPDFLGGKSTIFFVIIFIVLVAIVMKLQGRI